MIDDDSFLFPDCAENIMAVYEADPQGAVVGAQAALSATMRGTADLFAQQKEISSGATMNRQKYRWILRNIFLMRSEQIFIPYRDRYPDRPATDAIKRLGAHPERLFHGARMTWPKGDPDCTVRLSSQVLRASRDLARRFDVPQFRRALRAWRDTVDMTALEARYPRHQERIIKSCAVRSIRKAAE